MTIEELEAELVDAGWHSAVLGALEDGTYDVYGRLDVPAAEAIARKLPPPPDR
ncbi:hypothetical protein [Kribbella sp. DT2]|uniref:hypothetical protein n=1 Tax=Kribbella sp. DT2 TaxID=3393427 RepID=UPI003CF65DDC